MSARADKVRSATAVVNKSSLRQRSTNNSARVLRMPPPSSAVIADWFLPIARLGQEPTPAERRTAVTFRELAQVWSEQTAGLSSLDDVLAHPAYRAIVTMGESVVPL